LSVKTYCDRCKNEMDDTSRLIRKLGKRFQVEAISCVDGVWNGGHLCHECVKDVVLKGKTTKRSLL
jgi:hypothetical protein